MLKKKVGRLKAFMHRRGGGVEEVEGGGSPSLAGYVYFDLSISLEKVFEMMLN